MEFSIVLAFLGSFILNISSLPKNYDILPKDYYKRQILQPIPGYIPVYIKTEAEPFVRSEPEKQIPKVNPQASDEPKPNLPESIKKELISKDEIKAGEQNNSDTEVKESSKIQKKLTQNVEDTVKTV